MLRHCLSCCLRTADKDPKMDSVLSEFIERTKAEPALARDLLEATNWNLDMAIMTYNSFQETKVVNPPEYVYDPSKKNEDN